MLKTTTAIALLAVAAWLVTSRLPILKQILEGW